MVEYLFCIQVVTVRFRSSPMGYNIYKKQFKYRLYYQKKEVYNRFINILLRKKYICHTIKLYYMLYLINFNYDSSLSRHQNFCLITMRRNSVYSVYGLSRMAIKFYGSERVITRLIKHSW